MKKAVNSNKSNKHTLNNYFVFNCLCDEYNTFKKAQLDKGTSEETATLMANRKFFNGKEPINYKQFVAIQENFGKLMMDAVLKGYKFIIPYIVCKVGLIKKRRNINKLAINWGESDRLKAELLSKGLEPAKQLKEGETNYGQKDKFGNPILSNDNLWQVFYTDDWIARLVYMPIKIIGGTKLKSMFTLFWRASFVKAFKEELYLRIRNKEIVVEAIIN